MTLTNDLKTIKILMVDNYDSFTFNLVHYLQQIEIENSNIEIVVKRNDQITLDDIKELVPTHIVISPGPCNPDKAGLSLEIVKHFYKSIPILGICLGHQVIGQFFGGKVIKAEQVVHGKTSTIYHTGHGIFNLLPQGFQATRYHSLVLDPANLPHCLEVTAWTQKKNVSGEIENIMAIKHRDFPIEGVQFHPESILSEHGLKILQNFFVK